MYQIVKGFEILKLRLVLFASLFRNENSFLSEVLSSGPVDKNLRHGVT